MIIRHALDPIELKENPTQLIYDEITRHLICPIDLENN